MHGKKVDVSTVGKAVDARARLCHRGPQDLGLILIDHIKHNITLANLKAVSHARRDRRHRAS